MHRLANLPPCLVGLGAGSGSHHIARQIQALGHVDGVHASQQKQPAMSEMGLGRRALADHLCTSQIQRNNIVPKPLLTH